MYYQYIINKVEQDRQNKLEFYKDTTGQNNSEVFQFTSW